MAELLLLLLFPLPVSGGDIWSIWFRCALRFVLLFDEEFDEDDEVVDEDEDATAAAVAAARAA